MAMTIREFIGRRKDMVKIVTIRQYIEQRVRWALIAFVGVFAVTFFLPHKQGAHAVIIGVVGTIGATVAYFSLLFLRCPKCRANIGTTIELANHTAGCPHCSLRLDEEIETR